MLVTREGYVVFVSRVAITCGYDLLTTGAGRGDPLCKPFGGFIFEGYLVLYVDTGQSTAQGLDNLAEFPLLSHHMP